MKKLITVFLVFCVILSGCSGTSDVTSDPLSLAQFEEKYKRAEWNEMLASPKSFFEDLHGIASLPFEQAVPEAASLNSTEEIYGTVYDKDIVLFNRPFTARITDYGKFFSCSLFYEGEPEECYASFKVLFEGLIKDYGDPEVLSVDRDDVDEASFRKALESGDLDVPVSAHWTKKADPDDISLALISYWNYTGATLSFY